MIFVYAWHCIFCPRTDHTLEFLSLYGWKNARPKACPTPVRSFSVYPQVKIQVVGQGISQVDDVFAWTHWNELSFPALPSLFPHIWASALQLWGDSYQCDKHVPSTAQEGKEKERESGAATSHPSKRYENRDVEVFQILSTIIVGQQCGMWPVLAPIGGGRNGPRLLLGPGFCLPAALAIEKLVTKSKQKVSPLSNQKRQRNLYSNIQAGWNFMLGVDWGKPAHCTLKISGHLRSRASWADNDQPLGLISGTSLSKICDCLWGQSHKHSSVLSELYWQCQDTGREEGKDLKPYCGLDHKWPVLKGFSCFGFCTQTACFAYHIC